MDKNDIDVDDILNDIAFKKVKDACDRPKRDMQSINDMVEQILKEKKMAQLEKEKASLSNKEMEEIEKEIRFQTKSITRQFERAVKENTRQVKRLKREEKEFEEELKADKERHANFEIEKEFLNKNTQQLKLSSIAQNQAVKLAKPASEIVETKQKQEKLDFLKLTAHNKIIKRELMDITTHFGNFANKDANQNFIDDDDDELEEKLTKKSFITASGFKEFKKNRNKRIDKFVLNPETDPKKVAAEEKHDINQDENEEKTKIDIEETPLILNEKELEKELEKAQEKAEDEAEEKAEEILQDEAEETEAEVLENSLLETILDEDYEDNDFEFTKKEQTQSVFTKLLKKRHSEKINVVAFSILSILAIFISLFTTGENGITFFSFKIEPIVYAGANLILLLVSTSLVCKCFKNAYNALRAKTVSKDILYSLTIIIALITNTANVISPESLLNPSVHIFTPVVVVSLLFYSISKLYYATQMYDNFCYIANEDSDKFTITKVLNQQTSADMTKGLFDDEPVLVKNVKTNFFDKFIENSTTSDESDVRLAKISIFVLPIAVIFAIITFVLTKDLFVSLTSLSAIMAVSTTLIGSFIVIFPLNDTSKITRHFGEMTPCVGAIDDMLDVNSTLIEAYDLFPADSIILHGIKTFSGKRIDDAILDAASVVCQSKSILSSVFLNIIAQNNELLKTVDTIVYEDLMGLSAWVDNKRVLIGNRELMINHSIAVPSKNYEEKYTQVNQHVVYLATEGELAAAFIVQLTATKESFDAMSLLERNDVKIIVKTADSILTSERLAILFHLEDDSIKVLPSRLHKAYHDEMAQQENTEILLGNNGTLMGGIISTVATKKMSFCVDFGAKLNLIQIVIAIILLVCLSVLGKLSGVTNIFMICYMLLFGLFYWICEKNVHL